MPLLALLPLVITFLTISADVNDGVLRSRLVVKSSGRSPAAMSRSLVCVRRQALGLYRSLLRTAQHWEANDVEDTVNERNYIRHEAKELFAENKHVRSSGH